MKNYLPLKFQQNPILSKIFSYVQESKTMFSVVLCLCPNTKKYHIINKNKYAPYIQLDWQVYSQMRFWANTIISAASNLREQPSILLSNYSFDDENIKEMYNNIRKNKMQNVYILTNTFQQNQLENFINKQLYSLLNGKIKFNSNQKIIDEKTKKMNIFQLIKWCHMEHLGPIVIEAGLTTLDQYFQILHNQASQDNSLFGQVDLILLSYYLGESKPQFVGKEFNIPLEKMFEEVWKSEAIPVAQNNVNKIYFVVYRRK